MSVYVIRSSNYDAEDHKKWSASALAPMYDKPHPDSAPEKLKLLLPPLPKPYPFEIDDCGFVVMTEAVAGNTFGRGTDEYGRNVFIVANRFLYSRHSPNSFYVYAQTWEVGQAIRPSSYERVPDEMWGSLLAAAEKQRATQEKEAPKPR